MPAIDPSAWLRRLRVTRLFATWVPEQPWQPPPVFANTLRGAVGASVMDVACVRSSRECEGCPAQEGCPVLGWYDPNRTGGNRPRPYTIRVLQGHDDIAPHRPLVVQWLLTGPTPHTHMLVEALLRAGRKGFGLSRVPHHLARLDARGDGGLVQLVADGRVTGTLPRPGLLLHHVQLPERPHRATVELLTPVQVPALVRDPDPRVLLQAGIHRLHDLARDAHVPMERWWDLDQVVATWEGLEYLRHRRWSKRQEADVDLSGVVGCLVIRDGADEVADLLAAMEVVGVGRNTSVGMGQVQVHWQ